MNFPSIKRIQRELAVEPETAKAIRAHMEAAQGYRPTFPITIPGIVVDWAKRCYPEPRRREQHHAALAYLVTEGRTITWEVFQPQEEWPSFADGPAWEAIATGDPYTTTLILRDGRYSLGCWGDLPEVQ